MAIQNATQRQIGQIAEKLQFLSPARILEVEDFVDFLRQRDEDRALTQAAMATSEPAFQRVWDNSEDAEYDNL